MKSKVIFKGLGLLAMLAAIGFAIKSSGLDAVFDKTWVDADIRGQGVAGELLFFVVATVFTSVGMPRLVMAFLGGYAFGLVNGVLIALLATLTGCIVAFYFARLLGRDYVTRRFPRRVRRINDFLSENPFTMTLLIRFLPGSNVVTNLAAGVSSVRGLPFFLGSAIGYAPQTVVFALAGSGVDLDPVFRTSLAAALFVISGVLGVYLYRKHRHGKSLGAEMDRELEADEQSENYTKLS